MDFGDESSLIQNNKSQYCVAMTDTAGYLSPPCVKKFGKPYEPNAFCIETVCYDNGLFKVCPDPKDKRRSNSIETMYESGRYIHRDTVCLTMQAYLKCMNNKQSS